MGILVGYSAWCGVVNMWSCSLSFRVLQSLFKTFAITFSTMAIFIGTPLYGPSLLYAGPASMIWGYVGVTFFTWFVGFAMAEICSSFPVRIILLLLRSSYFICLSLFLQRASFIFLKTTPAAFCELDCQHSLKTWVFYFVDLHTPPSSASQSRKIHSNFSAPFNFIFLLLFPPKSEYFFTHNLIRRQLNLVVETLYRQPVPYIFGLPIWLDPGGGRLHRGAALG